MVNADVFKALAETCSDCHGTGVLRLYGPSGTHPRFATRRQIGNSVLLYELPNGCKNCDGTGKAWTEAGKILCELLRLKLNAVAAVPEFEALPDSADRPQSWKEAALDGLVSARPGAGVSSNDKHGFGTVLPAGFDSRLVG